MNLKATPAVLMMGSLIGFFQRRGPRAEFRPTKNHPSKLPPNPAASTTLTSKLAAGRLTFPASSIL